MGPPLPPSPTGLPNVVVSENMKISQLRRIARVYFHKTGIVGRHSNSSVRYNEVKFDTTAGERGSIIQGPYTLTTTSKPPRNQALLIFWRITRVTIVFPPSHP